VFDESAAQQWGKSYDHFLKRILPKEKNATILDVACGGGNLLYYFKSKGFTNIKGVDLSPEQISLARQVIDDVTLQDATAYLKDHPGPFDLITGLDIIEHFTKDEALDFLAAIQVALRPNGRVVLQTPNLGGFMGPSMRFGDFTHEIGLTPGSLENLLRIAGFTSYNAWECGPAPHGLASSIRFCLWQMIRAVPLIYDFVEVGGSNHRVYTRVFLASAIKTS
jgi:SAM-dependent methyltransferase